MSVKAPFHAEKSISSSIPPANICKNGRIIQEQTGANPLFLPHPRCAGRPSSRAVIYGRAPLPREHPAARAAKAQGLRRRHSYYEYRRELKSWIQKNSSIFFLLVPPVIVVALMAPFARDESENKIRKRAFKSCPRRYRPQQRPYPPRSPDCASTAPGVSGDRAIPENKPTFLPSDERCSSLCKNRHSDVLSRARRMKHSFWVDTTS